MKTPLPMPPPGPVTIPLTDELKAAYKDLYNQYQALIDQTTDPGFLQVLNDSQVDVDNILTKDAMYRIHADTALFQALLGQIKSTNSDLAKLKAQIQAVTTHLAEAGAVIAAINKVLALAGV